jgi:hypothetical protein
MDIEENNLKKNENGSIKNIIGIFLIIVSIFLSFIAITVSKETKKYNISTKAKIIKKKCQLVAIKTFRPMETSQKQDGWVQHYNDDNKVENVYKKNLGKMKLHRAIIIHEAKTYLFDSKEEEEKYKIRFSRECKYELSYKVNDKKYKSSLIKYYQADGLNMDEMNKREEINIMANKDNPSKIIEKTSKHKVNPIILFIISGILFIIAIILFFLSPKPKSNIDEFN